MPLKSVYARHRYWPIRISHRQFILDTDASGYAISGVLSQLGGDGQEHPIACYSRTLNKCDRNYSTTRRELSAVIDSMENFFRVYLTATKFLLRPITRPSNGWPISKTQFVRTLAGKRDWPRSTLDIQHRPGKKHANADALSRLCADGESHAIDTSPSWLPVISKQEISDATAT